MALGTKGFLSLSLFCHGVIVGRLWSRQLGAQTAFIAGTGRPIRHLDWGVGHEWRAPARNGEQTLQHTQ